MPDSAPRSAAIDNLRALAVILMVTYHLMYDLSVYYQYPVDVFGGFWKYIEVGTAGIFLLLTGLCFSISWSRKPSGKKFLLRGLRIFGYGCVVSVATYVIDPQTFVRFGILHLIGAATMLLPLFVGLGYWNTALGIVVIELAWFIEPGTAATSMLIPFGLTPPDFHTVDYFPFTPWFGIILIGVAAGRKYVSVSGNRTYCESSAGTKTRPGANFAVQLISKRSLLIYMVHLPLIIVILWLMQSWLGLHQEGQCC